MGRVAALLTMMAVVLGSTAWAQAPSGDRRVALVIGNGNYQGAAKLANPVNDARAMAAKLKKLGFDVIAVEDGTQKAMQRAIGQFSNKLGEDAISLFYYAGHGLQVSGHNYLVPIDAEISTEQTVRLEAIDVDAVIDQMSMAKSRVNLVILDACRNNPFERRFRSVGGGLASIEAPTGTLIAYATSPGKVAADGEGANGLYTAELLGALDTPGAKVEDVFKRTRAAVVAKSSGNQTPWESSSLTGDFYFVGPSAAASGDRETMVWSSVKDSRSAAVVQTYLDQFPKGTYAPTARAMIDDLKRAPTQVAAAPDRAMLAPPPQLKGRGLEAFDQFLKAESNRAFAIAWSDQSGAAGVARKHTTPFRAMTAAIRVCTQSAKAPCRAYAVENSLVIDRYAAFETASGAALPKLRDAQLARPAYGEEDADFQVAPTTALRAEKYHAETPRTLAGAKTVSTKELLALIVGPRPPVLIDVLDGPEDHFTLPKAWWWRGAGNHGKDNEASISQLFGQMLATAVPSKDAPVAFFCESSRCWLSYNAALRAVAAGYTNVLWYRGGTIAWKAADLPRIKAALSGQFL